MSTLKRKLTSRKFWLAVTSFITELLLAYGYGEGAVTKVIGIVMSGATVIAYIIGEGLADSNNSGDNL